MKLAQRLLLGSLLIVAVLVAVVLNVIDRGLSRRLDEQAVDELQRQARAAATTWRPNVDADSLADVLGAALGRRVMLIAPDGRVLGDSEVDGQALAALEPQNTRPEVAAAASDGEGVARRASSSAGDEVHAAVRTPRGVLRVSANVAALQAAVVRARRAVLLAGAAAMTIALVLATLFARSVSRPIVELRDVAATLAGGDLSRRPQLSAPGEVGDLALAVRSLGEQLGSRLTALQAEEALSNALLEALNEGVMAVSSRREVVRINDAGRRILGVRDDVPFPIDHLSRDRALRAAVDAALSGEVRDSAEIAVGGRTLVLTALPLGGGGAVVALYDLTATRRLERVRSDFVANVSHELKTPLTVISGFAETILDDDLPPDKRKQFAGSIRNNAARMQRLVDDLLDLSRIESGGWKPDPSLVDLVHMFGEVANGVQTAAAEKTISVESAVAPGAESILADATAVRQIMTNLAENAVRYTREGSVTLFSEPAEGGVWVGVRDTGIGIPAEHLSRIFERFYRVDAARSRALGGTGLGLSIVKHLVEAHGGRVRAESAVGRGTTVAVFIPVVA